MGENNKLLILKAPLSGVAFPLEMVPDPVFAQKLVGDGISLDPIDAALRAPCDGKIIQIHNCKHALTIECEDKVEVLMHIGLDTVHLKGEGFTQNVQVGDLVKTGQILISFDSDLVATRAKSLLTQVVITTPELARIMKRAEGKITGGETDLLELEIISSAPSEISTKGSKVSSESAIVPNPNGFHARPAAMLSQLARRFSSTILIQKGELKGNSKSVSAIMALNIGKGEKIVVIAEGIDAEEAVSTLLSQIRSGLGEDLSQEKSVTVPWRESREIPRGAFPGIPASSGFAIGKTWCKKKEEWKIPEKGENPKFEQNLFNEALEKSCGQLHSLHDRLWAQGETEKAEIFSAHQEILADPEVLELVESAIAKGKSAGAAWRAAFTTQATRLENLNNELLAARANDLRDVGHRVLRHILGTSSTPSTAPAGAIILAEELTPSETADLNSEEIAGLVTVGGGATSHVAIIARSSGLPALVGVNPKILDIADGTVAIIDGFSGVFHPNPSESELQEAKTFIASQEENLQEQKLAAKASAAPLGGREIAVMANLGDLSSSQKAIDFGCDGVGLLRSEFLFLNRPTPPDEDEQVAAYRSVLEKIGKEKPLTIRVLDVGGDKPLPFLSTPKEENPFLGERGIRLLLQRPDIFEPQIRAILRSSEFGKVKIMIPMVSNLDEFMTVKDLVGHLAKKLNMAPVPLGTMIEVPAAALLAERFARVADFFSLGTNDLTQYTLAMDRGHPKLAPQIDGLHPAVLALISQTISGGHSHGKPVGICGGMASDPQAVPILLGLGLDSLSVDIPSIPAIKDFIRRLENKKCVELAKMALNLSSATEVRKLAAELVQTVWEKQGD